MVTSSSNPQNIAEWNKNNPRSVARGDDKTPEGESLDQFWKKRKDSLEAKVKIRELEREESRYDVIQTGLPVTGQGPVSKDDVSMGKLMLEMLQSERESRKAAEESRTTTERNYWDSQSKWLDERINEFRQERATKTEEPYEVYQKWKGIMDGFKAEVTKDLPKGIMEGGINGTVAIQLEQMRQQHEERMTEIRHLNATTLEQMRENHDIAMQEAADRRLEMEIKMKELEIGGAKKQDTWASIMDFAGKTVQAGLLGQPNPAGEMTVPVGTQRRSTPAGIRAYRCQKCKYPIPMPPDMEPGGILTCPQCSMQYQVGQPPPPVVEEPQPSTAPEHEVVF